MMSLTLIDTTAKMHLTFAKKQQGNEQTTSPFNTNTNTVQVQIEREKQIQVQVEIEIH